MDYTKDVVWISVLAPEFYKKHLKKAGGRIGRNFVNITMKTIVRKPWMIEIVELCLRKSENLESYIPHLISAH